MFFSKGAAAFVTTTIATVTTTEMRSKDVTAVFRQHVVIHYVCGGSVQFSSSYVPLMYAGGFLLMSLNSFLRRLREMSAMINGREEKRGNE